MSFADKARKILKEMKDSSCEKSELSEKRPLPYLDLDGSLVIPFGCDSRYQWWNGGQTLAATETEIKRLLH